MDRDGIITSVKVKIDELTPDGAALPLEEIIGPVLDSAKNCCWPCHPDCWTPKI